MIARALSFLGLAFGLLALYAYPGDEDGARMHFFAWFLSSYAKVAALAIRTIDASAVSIGQDIVGRTSLRIIKGCDALDVTLALASAVLVFPSSVRERALALPLAFACLATLNVFRIWTLYFLQLNRPEYFEFIHMEVWPLLLVLAAAFGFLIWANSVQKRARA